MLHEPRCGGPINPKVHSLKAPVKPQMSTPPIDVVSLLTLPHEYLVSRGHN